MPSVPYTHQARVGRFRDQRWLLDSVIRVLGPEFDQSRLHYLGAPMGADWMGAVLGLEKQVARWDDIAPVFARTARRFELQAVAAERQGHRTTAGDAYFAAAVLYGGAQWPIFAQTDLLAALERKKNECYAKFIGFADHRVEAVRIPYGDASLAAHLHLPPTWRKGEKLPVVVMIEGMDAFKELAVASAGDRFLRRGLACLVIDGPGQGTALAEGVWFDPDRYGEVGTAAVDWLLQRPEIDPDRIIAWGLSFGSYWATVMAAHEPRFCACAVMYTCFQPRNWPLLEMASPSFRQRMMFMAGLAHEAELDAFMAKMDVMPLGPKLTMPYLVMAGEDDSLSDLSCTFEHMNNVAGPKTLYVYAGEEHGFGGSPSSQLGTPFFLLMADWLADRAAGKPLESTYNLIDRTGQMHSEPYGQTRSYQYGAPLGVEQLWSEHPPLGLS